MGQKGRNHMKCSVTRFVATVLLSSLIASQAHATIEVRRLLFRGKSPQSPEIRFLVASSDWGGYSAQLWKGDYLWAGCRQMPTPKAQGALKSKIVRFECGHRTIEWTSNGQAVLVAAAGNEVRFTSSPE